MGAYNSITKPCSNCGKNVTKPPSLLKHAHNFCNRRCWNDWRRRMFRFRGYIDARGYRRVTVNGKMWLEHRYVLSQHLGRKLGPKEYVHHRNGNKLDNRPENLQIIPQKEHMHGHLFTGWNVQAALKMFHAGLTFTEIAKKLQTPAATIYSYLVKNKLHIPDRHRPRRWDLEKALALHKKGYNFTKIGAELGIPRETVYSYFVNHALHQIGQEQPLDWDTSTALKLHARKYTFSQIAEKLGVSRATIYSYFYHRGLHNPGQPRKTKWDIQKALNLRKKGWTFDRIAKQLGVHSATIVGYLLDHRLYTPQRGPRKGQPVTKNPEDIDLRVRR